MYICAWQAPALPPERWISSDRGGGRERQARTTELLRDQCTEIAGLGQGADELGRVGTLAVDLAPVLAGEAGAELGDLVAYFGVVLGEPEGLVHGGFPSLAPD